MKYFCLDKVGKRNFKKYVFSCFDNMARLFVSICLETTKEIDFDENARKDSKL